jgi:hypothetical protein
VHASILALVVEMFLPEVRTSVEVELFRLNDNMFHDCSASVGC